MEIELNRFDRQFRSFLEATIDARTLSERDVDYSHLAQWTEEEENTIKSRGQAVVVFDYYREQVDYMLGMERDSRTEPRAIPRTKKHEGAADACTDALRYVAEANDFIDTASDCFEDMLVPGYTAAIVEPERDGDDYKISIRGIPWDRFYFDPHSRRRDFGDATFMGIVIWMDAGQAKRTYKGKDKEIDQAINASDAFDGDTFEDKPLWVDSERKRLRVCQHYYLNDGVWWMCHFSGLLKLIDPEPSKLLDENGEPSCPIEAQSAYVDRDNARYGYMRRFIDPQNEINHRRSKALHLLSSNQVIAEEGVVKDRAVAKRELKKPDGWLEVRAGALAKREIQINSGNEPAAGQIQMYSDAVNKVNVSGTNAAMQGDVSGMSGRAIQRIQHGGSIQVGPIFDAHKNFKRRIYRQVWNRVKQFWDAERWIRVTDDEENLKWVGLNTPVTVKDELIRAAKAGDQEAAVRLQQAMAVNDPELSRVIDTENNVADIDVDIIIDESPDMLSTQEEQLKMVYELAKIYGPQQVPFKAIIELSNVKNKRRVNELISGDDEASGQRQQMEQMQQQIQQVMTQLNMQSLQAKTAKTVAETEKIGAQTEQTRVETATVATFPDIRPNIII